MSYTFRKSGPNVSHPPPPLSVGKKGEIGVFTITKYSGMKLRCRTWKPICSALRATAFWRPSPRVTVREKSECSDFLGPLFGPFGAPLGSFSGQLGTTGARFAAIFFCMPFVFCRYLYIDEYLRVSQDIARCLRYLEILIISRYCSAECTSSPR